jgi:hypothetical protein
MKYITHRRNRIACLTFTRPIIHRLGLLGNTSALQRLYVGDGLQSVRESARNVAAQFCRGSLPFELDRTPARVLNRRMTVERSITVRILSVAGCLAAWASGGTSASPTQAVEQDSKALPFIQTAHKPSVPITTVSGGSFPSIQVDINRSMKARRALAWDIVQKVWTPVGSPGAQVPAWMTWYEQEDIEPLFREMLAGSVRLTTRAQVAARVSTVMGKHTEKDLQRSLSSARLGRVLRQFTFPEFAALQLHAKPGTGSIYYNPAYVTHLLANAEQIARYDPAAFQHRAPKTQRAQGEAEIANLPVAANAYALSMNSEMPADALMIKVDWVPVEQGAASYYTEGKNLAKGFLESPTGNFDLIVSQGKLFTYKIATPEYRSGAARLIVVSDEQGKKWALMGMHIASKVRRTWVWITFMWLAPRAPNWEADRPAFFTQYENDPEPWRTWPLHQYGMAVASDFRESDPAPGAAFDRVPEANHIGPNSDLHEMATSLKDLAAAMKGLQWCANPFIEVGMSHTNCIGCHQGSPNEFLATTLTKARSTNAGDFSFSIASNRETFIRVLRERRSAPAAKGAVGR